MGMRKAMRVSKIGKKASVFRGIKVKTVGGLKKTDLKRSKSGKIVSRKMSERAQKIYKKNGLQKWNEAVMRARKDLGIKGWCSVGGKKGKGAQLLQKARSYYKK